MSDLNFIEAAFAARTQIAGTIWDPRKALRRSNAWVAPVGRIISGSGHRKLTPDIQGRGPWIPILHGW
jgi:hypothetical protein